jgi:undecaprenyl-diphosphatase
MQPPPDESRERVRRTLEQEVAQIDSPETAEAVVRRAERLAGDATEQQKAQEAAAAPDDGATAVERAADETPPRDEAAAVLVTAAAQAVAPTPEAPAVLEAAQQALGTQPALGAQPAAGAPATGRGRDLLKAAVLRRMGPLQALDARLFLAVNGGPHPRAADALANAVTVWCNGGWIWSLGVAVAALGRVPRSRQALAILLPVVAGATWTVEYPIKALFRRQRPFIDVVRALVVGKRPGSWSFPSGHTASSFAAAWVLSTVWPRGAPIFFALASGVGFSRVYVGAHYPGDVSSGALLGMLLAEVLRRVVCGPLRRAARRPGN